MQLTSFCNSLKIIANLDEVLFSHIIQVHIKRSVAESEDIVSSQNGDASHLIKPSKPLVRKSKLVVVDLAGSERVHKSGVH